MVSNQDTVKGKVTEIMPNSLYRVQLEDDKIIVAHLAGKLRIHRIRVLAGDQVSLILSPDGDKGRIVYRL
ncbi:translation initiation factor IF-1 [Patescibacteria group bacterium]|nr:translation initiation factor IF-1 [Patescibacteria group bacterium]